MRGLYSAEAVDWVDRRFTAVTRGSQEDQALRWLDENLDGGAQQPRGWLRRIEPGAYRRWPDGFARMPLAITVDTRHGPVGIVHPESPHESWVRATDLPEHGRELDVALFGRAGAGLGAREYRRRRVEGVRAVVHGHEPVSEPEYTSNRLILDTGAGITYLDLLTLARIDVERLETMTYDVVDW